MEVHFTPEQEAQIQQAAANAGTDAEHLVKDAVLRLVEGNADLRAVRPGAVRPGAVHPGSVVSEMRALRARVKPDPEGWTTLDYVHYGRP
jgi:hypothetical protein